jgi:hypothetical protein
MAQAAGECYRSVIRVGCRARQEVYCERSMKPSPLAVGAVVLLGVLLGAPLAGVEAAERAPAAAAPADDDRPCRNAARVFAGIDGRQWPQRAAPAIRAAIDKLTTRDYDEYETLNARRATIFLEGATSSVHWHDVAPIGDVELAGKRLKIVAVWSLAYGKGALDSERVLSLLAYAQEGSTWRLAASGIGLATYVGPRTAPPRLVQPDAAFYAVELTEGAAAPVPTYYLARRGCFRAAAAHSLDELRAELAAGKR